MPERSPITAADVGGLPITIVADLLEASTCTTPALTGRRHSWPGGVEQVVVMRGVPLDMTTLHQKLVWLLESGHLPAALVGAARTVRDVGNAPSHGAEVVGRDEAKAMMVASLALVRGALPMTSE